MDQSAAAMNGSSSCSSDEEMPTSDLRRGPWTLDEDLALINYIALHGEGRWNSLARSASLKRTGKSCRLRWLNYLRPDVRRGNITLEEQLLILELHSRWGNRWSKIAQFLPGRTDNEIKNYWRTRVQKHAKQLKCDVNSQKFKDAMRYLWMPRLVERIQAASTTTTTTNTVGPTNAAYNEMFQPAPILESLNFTSDDSSMNTSSSTEFAACNNYGGYQGEIGNGNGNGNGNWSQVGGDYVADTLTSPCGNYFDQGWSSAAPVEGGSQWYGGGGEDTSEFSWNVEDMFVFQQQFDNSSSFNI